MERQQRYRSGSAVGDVHGPVAETQFRWCLAFALDELPDEVSFGIEAAVRADFFKCVGAFDEPVDGKLNALINEVLFDRLRPFPPVFTDREIPLVRP